MGNVSWQLGTAQNPASAERAVSGRAAAADAPQRMLAHLQANEVDLQATPLRVGRLLELDPATERFADADAQRLAKGASREAFRVPERV